MNPQEIEIAEPSHETMEEMYVNMGPQHPSTHGVLRLMLKLNGEVVTEIIPYLGYLHRCHEKIGENRTYTQIIPYTDRLDYLASMYNNFGYVLTVERLVGITVPERAEYMRVILGELQRIASHLIWLGTFGLDLGNFTIFMYCFREREKILDLFESVSGQRLNYAFYRIGGMPLDFPDSFVTDCQAFLEWFKPRLPEYDAIMSDNIIFQKRVQGLGKLDAKTAIDYAISGPMLRASGIKWDLRRNDPYSIYDRFEFDIPVGTSGDVWDRYMVRRIEMEESVKIVEQALRGLPSGEIIGKMPKKLKPPVGDIYTRVESPRGELGFYLVSDGSEKPYRYKVRSPAFVNLSVLPVIGTGCLVADVVAILGSIDIVLGEVDR
ncbi:NADH-quinone oxidoreductase subunit D [Candidatus Methylomirabilis sp.]|uniref:NADH-quinone oxidoreductase subunit D n=1 Tax=Candidatus Methylomirabilis sp. TaxID=2032687 RepID=UPI002A681E4A|nr:NADH-quinone oxidoreductase subunit D [Candidatus Methylomirabilis sp.]